MRKRDPIPPLSIREAAHTLLDAALIRAEQATEAQQEMQTLLDGVTSANVAEVRRKLPWREERIAQLEGFRDELAGWLQSLIDGDQFVYDDLLDVVQDARKVIAAHERQATKAEAGPIPEPDIDEAYLFDNFLE